MKAWFQQLSERERWIVGSGAAITAAMLLYLVVISPIYDANQNLQEEIVSKRSTASWMAGAVVEARALSGTESSVPQTDERSLIARVSAELRAKKIVPTRIKPEGEKRLSVSLENVAFDALMERIDLLQHQYGISVSNAMIQPQSSAGLINAQLTFNR